MTSRIYVTGAMTGELYGEFDYPGNETDLAKSQEAFAQLAALSAGSENLILTRDPLEILTAEETI